MSNYFRTLRFWWAELLPCYVVAALVTPADPRSAIMAFVVIFPVWMAIRWMIARRLSRSVPPV